MTIGKIEQFTNSAIGSCGTADRKSAIEIDEKFGETNKATLEFEIDASGSTAEEVNSLIEKICEAQEKKRFLTIKVKM